MRVDHVRRRAFLRAGASGLLALPLLPSLFEAEANAQANTPAKRLFAIKSYSSQRVVDWYPRFAGRGYRARPFTPGNGKADGSTVAPHPLEVPSGRRAGGREYFGHWANLEELASAGSLSAILGPRLTPFASEMLLVRGLDFMPETSHNDGGMLGNYAGASLRYRDVEPWPTIDQTLAYSPRFYPRTPAGPRSVHLSLSNRNTCSFTDYGSAGGAVSQVQAHTDPRTAFAELFAAALDGERATRLKLVDQVLEDYRAARVHPRLGASDRQVIEQHLALLSELEEQLQAKPERQCSVPETPSAGEAVGVDAEDVVRVMQQMVDLALLALRCDLTRIVTLDVWKAVGRAAGPGGADWGYAHSSAKDARDWHERVHEFGRPEADAQVRAINQWIAAEVFLRVLEGLHQEEDAGQTYLDRSVVFWGNELGMNHMNYSVPALLAGRAGGRLQAGRYLDYIDWDQPLMQTQENAPIIEGVPHNRMLVTLLQAFGLTPGDYEREGQAGYGCYRTTGKHRSQHALDYDASQYGNPLPGLLL